jgi:phosphoglycolate phosphatase
MSIKPATLSDVIRNIIFDWCGTLVNDLEAVWKATNQTFEKSGVAPLSLESFRQEFSLPFRPFYERYTPHIEAAQLEEWYLQAFDAEQGSIEPFAHSKAFLDYCQQQNIATFILSSIHASHFEKHLSLTGFESYFRETYVGVHDKRQKIHSLLETHQLSPGETLFVGDMQHDIDAAKHGKTRSCGVLTGFNSLQQLEASEPDLIVEHLGELQRLLHRHQGEMPSEEASTPSSEFRIPISTVGALIFDQSEKVLMIQTHKWSNKWGIPGGKIQFGESSEAALEREILEETNLKVRDIHFVMVQDAIFSEEFYRKEHFLLLNYTCQALPPLDTKLNHEAQTFRWVTLDQALALDLNQPTKALITTVIQQRAKAGATS